MKLNEFSKGSKNTEEMRELLLRHSIAEFSKKGYNGTNLDEIAKALKISKKTIYTLFPSKSELYIESCLAVFLGLTDLAIPIFNNDSLNPIEKLSKLINTILQYLSSVSPILLNDLRLHFPKRYMEFLSFREFMIIRYIEILKNAQALKMIREDIDVEFLVDIMLNVANTIIVPEYIIAKNTTISNIIEKFFDILVFGIANPETKENLRGIKI